MQTLRRLRWALFDRWIRPEGKPEWDHRIGRREALRIVVQSSHLRMRAFHLLVRQEPCGCGVRRLGGKHADLYCATHLRGHLDEMLSARLG